MAAKAAIKNVLSIQSHVVFGAAGNAAAVFPMRRLGANVWPLNTVQFSNHTQYGAWEGLATPDDQISALVSGIEARGVLGRCDAVLSGYLSTAAQGSHILEAVARVRAANPAAIYCCDPVMGHPEKGCVVSPEVQQFHTEEAAAAADILCPNVLELGVLCGGSPGNPSEVIDAARGLLSRNQLAEPACGRWVLVKHLAHAGLRPDEAFEMLLVSAREAWHIATPLLPFARPPVGVGDLTTGIFLVNLLRGIGGRAALEHTASAYHAVMQATLDAEEYELQLVAAQDEIARPTRTFEAQSLA